MSTTGNTDKERLAEKSAAGESKIAIAPGRVGDDYYCPPRIPSDKNDSKDVKQYKDELKSCANHLLREVRVEVQEVARILDEHVAGNLDIKSHLHELDSSKKDIDDRISDLKDNYLSHIPPVDYYSEIFNLWQMAEGSTYFHKSKRDEFLDKPEQERLREINILKDRLSRLLFLIEYATGKERINNWIKTSRPGYALPFHSIFEDEIKSLEDRQKILKLYSLQPKSILGGLLDPVRGVILCYPQRIWDRIIRHAIIVLFFVLSFVVVDQLGAILSAPNNFGSLLGIEKINESFLLLCWTMMLIGIVGHVLVTSAKTSNVEFRQFPMPLRDWEYYLAARTTMILYKITLAIFIFLATFVLLKGKISLLEAFLIGYSFDSVVELIGVSLEKRSAASINVIKGKLGVAG